MDEFDLFVKMLPDGMTSSIFQQTDSADRDELMPLQEVCKIDHCINPMLMTGRLVSTDWRGC